MKTDNLRAVTAPAAKLCAELPPDPESGETEWTEEEFDTLYEPYMRAVTPGVVLRLLDERSGSPETPLATVSSRYFEIQGRLRLGDTVVEERTVVQREGLDVRPLQRARSVLGLPSAPAGR